MVAPQLIESAGDAAMNMMERAVRLWLPGANRCVAHLCWVDREASRRALNALERSEWPLSVTFGRYEAAGFRSADIRSRFR